jgi:uncharacterized membrane protein
MILWDSHAGFTANSKDVPAVRLAATLVQLLGLQCRTFVIFFQPYNLLYNCLIE